MSDKPTTQDLTPIARAIHEGLGESWAYSNYGGDEWNSMRTELMSAAASAWLVISPEIDQLRAALNGLLEHYTGLVNSGDCGHWNPEEETEVMAAREALK